MAKEKETYITKASGDKVMFSEEKLRASLQRSGAAPEMITSVVNEVRSLLYDGMPTKVIYKTAFDLLRKLANPVAARYKLKGAILELGPSGYPFEKYIGELFKFQGFQVQVGIVAKGHCVNHEVDVIADKADVHLTVECKFHNRNGIICDVKTPLYVYSRYKDLEKEYKGLKGHDNKDHQGWLVTNTRFSADAIQYGSCIGLHLLSWDYPKNGCLRQLIDIAGLHPLTCLTTLTNKEKQILLDNKVVLCREISEKPAFLNVLAMPQARKDRTLKECRELLAKY